MPNADKCTNYRMRNIEIETIAPAMPVVIHESPSFGSLSSTSTGSKRGRKRKLPLVGNEAADVDSTVASNHATPPPPKRAKPGPKPGRKPGPKPGTTRRAGGVVPAVPPVQWREEVEEIRSDSEPEAEDAGDLLYLSEPAQPMILESE